METRSGAAGFPAPALALALTLALLPAAPAAAQAGAVPARLPAVAILDFSNAGMDPRTDYLAGIIQGLVAYDLGTAGGVALLDRRNLETLLKEKELAMSALGDDTGAAASFGKLAGADWLVSGEYTFLGGDVLVTISLTDTATAKRVVFRDRGGTENLVHRLAEQMVLRLTGRQVALADPSRERSLVSLRDETPGSIALHSPIIDAEIFLDGQFAGYTTGNDRVPFLMEKVSAGRHRLRVHLGNSFGVVRMPQVEFVEWDTEILVEAGKRIVVRDMTRHFNDILYRLAEIDSGSVMVPLATPERLAASRRLAYADRLGRGVAVSLDAESRVVSGRLVVELVLTALPGPVPPPPASPVPGIASGPPAALPAAPPLPPASARLLLSRALTDQDEAEGKAVAGALGLEASLRRYNDNWRLEWTIRRSDIRQNMFRE